LPHGPCLVSAVGEPGELISRITTSSIDRRFDGYLDRAATQKKILRDVFRKGDMWFRTGDLLRRDHLGYYFFVDRLGDTFRWCGENVATTEVEKCINSSTNPKIEDSTVYGVRVPGAEGRAGMACVCLEKSYDSSSTTSTPTYPSASASPPQRSLEALYHHCTENLPMYAIPVFLRVRSPGAVRTRETDDAKTLVVAEDVDGTTKMDLTATFKHRKNVLKGEGFDPRCVRGDELYVRSIAKKTWIPLSKELYQQIIQMKYRL